MEQYAFRSLFTCHFLTMQPT